MKAKAAALCLMLAVFPRAADAESELPDVCQLFEGDPPVVNQTLYMHQEEVSHELTVPIIYFEDPWDRVDGEIYAAQMFSVTFDEFIPVYREHSAALLREGNGGYFTFLLHDLLPPDELFESSLWLSVVWRSAVPGLRADPTSFFDLEDTDVGLLFAAPVNTILTTNEVFVHFMSNGDVSAVISCVRENEALNPRCNHDFRAHSIDIRANYRRVNLARWRQIQEDLTHFVGCMIQD